ncbi:MAG: glycosyltransferase family 39 protein [Candidatus Moraniibacteriota bacterium]
MIKNIENIIKKIPRNILILAGIILVGIFLRTYHFHDWLRFNADQARDAAVVSNFLTGKSELPMLGPKAGGTEFKLGGAFYYLQILSAKIFGSSPDKIAYPDLLSSILTIPLLFLLLRKAFQEKIALAGAAILSVSIFAIKYGRFAWNPNSAPFYCLLLLYALLILAENKTRRWLWWALLAGLALGIGVQLHTLLLIIMPIATLAYFVFLGIKNPQLWRKALLVLLVALFFNTGQIINLAQTNGANAKAFFGGASAKTAKGTSLLGNLATNTVCQVQANAFIVSGLGADDQCGTDLLQSTYAKTKGLTNKAVFVLGFGLSVIFSFGGIWLWILAIKHTAEPNKKRIFQLTGLYALIGFVLLIPLAKEISLRFYLALIFVPFMLLGLWLQALWHWRKEGLWIGGLLILLLIFTNLNAVQIAFADHAGTKQVGSSTDMEITLGEVEFVAAYIRQYAQADETVFVGGRQKYLFKYLKSIQYFTLQENIKLRALPKRVVLAPTLSKVFLGNAKDDGKLSKTLGQTYVGQNVQFFGRFSIEQLVVK